MNEILLCPILSIPSRRTLEFRDTLLEITVGTAPTTEAFDAVPWRKGSSKRHLRPARRCSRGLVPPP